MMRMITALAMTAGTLTMTACESTPKSNESASSGKASLLFVQTADVGTLTAIPGSDDTYRLRLTGAGAQVIHFTDRPERLAGTMSLDEFMSIWDEGADSFEDDPPNAAILCGDSDKVLVFEIRNPVRNGNTVEYTAKRLEGSESFRLEATSAGGAVPASVRHVSLFIDNLGDPYGQGLHHDRVNSDPMNRQDGFGLRRGLGDRPTRRGQR